MPWLPASATGTKAAAAIEGVLGSTGMSCQPASQPAYLTCLCRAACLPAFSAPLSLPVLCTDLCRASAAAALLTSKFQAQLGLCYTTTRPIKKQQAQGGSLCCLKSNLASGNACWGPNRSLAKIAEKTRLGNARKEYWQRYKYNRESRNLREFSRNTARIFND